MHCDFVKCPVYGHVHFTKMVRCRKAYRSRSQTERPRAGRVQLGGSLGGKQSIYGRRDSNTRYRKIILSGAHVTKGAW